jgi:predicted metal-dependent HD superfamily phosphohydrolase
VLTPLTVDIDLSILGQPPERFWEYESQIRREYEWVPENVFTEKGAEILQRFLSRKSIYGTAFFFDKYKRQARINLEASIQKLRGV